jgi:hypothetical protein
MQANFIHTSGHGFTHKQSVKVAGTFAPTLYGPLSDSDATSTCLASDSTDR